MKKEQAMKVAKVALDNTDSCYECKELSKIECGAGRACENGLAWSIRNAFYVKTVAGHYIINYTDYDECINIFRVVIKDNICIGYQYIDCLETKSTQLELCARICNMLNNIW